MGQPPPADFRGAAHAAWFAGADLRPAAFSVAHWPRKLRVGTEYTQLLRVDLRCQPLRLALVVGRQASSGSSQPRDQREEQPGWPPAAAAPGCAAPAQAPAPAGRTLTSPLTSVCSVADAAPAARRCSSMPSATPLGHAREAWWCTAARAAGRGAAKAAAKRRKALALELEHGLEPAAGATRCRACGASMRGISSCRQAKPRAHVDHRLRQHVQAHADDGTCGARPRPPFRSGCRRACARWPGASSSHRSLGHFKPMRGAARPVRLGGSSASASATPTASDRPDQSRGANGSASEKVSDAPALDCQLRPLRPRPRVCCSATSRQGWVSPLRRPCGER